jgi:hypothetical protein
MRGRIVGRAARPLALGSLAAAMLVTAGCGPFGIAIQQARDLIKSGAQDVAFAVVDSDGRVYPKTLYVKKDVHTIVWIADADVLQINADATPLKVECGGTPICVARMPANASGPFEYSGNVTHGTTTAQLDPHLIVVP